MKMIGFTGSDFCYINNLFQDFSESAVATFEVPVYSLLQ